MSDVFKNKKLPEVRVFTINIQIYQNRASPILSGFIQCHKLVTDILRDELQAKRGIHALSIQVNSINVLLGGRKICVL